MPQTRPVNVSQQHDPRLEKEPQSSTRGGRQWAHQLQKFPVFTRGAQLLEYEPQDKVSLH